MQHTKVAQSDKINKLIQVSYPGAEIGSKTQQLHNSKHLSNIQVRV